MAGTALPIKTLELYFPKKVAKAVQDVFRYPYRPINNMQAHAVIFFYFMTINKIQVEDMGEGGMLYEQGCNMRDKAYFTHYTPGVIGKDFLMAIDPELRLNRG